MKSKPIPQFPTAVLMLVALFSMSLVSSRTGSLMANHQKNHSKKQDSAAVTMDANFVTQTPTPIAILSTPSPALLAGAPSDLFSPDQISGGLQTTVNGVKWVTDISDSSVDPQSDLGWSDVTVLISVKCILKDGCQNISVMDYDLTYDEYVGDLIYGAQQEFGNTDLKPDETASGSITFAVPSTAKTFALRYAPKPMTIAEFSK